MTLLSITMLNVGNIKFETIIVDDGSSDCTYEVVQKFKNKLNLKYFFNEDNGYRVSLCRNIGIKNASGRIVLLVDSGMLLSPNYILKHYLSHKDDNVVVIGSIYGYDIKHENFELYDFIDLNDLDETFRVVESCEKYEDLRMEALEYYSNDISNLRAPYSFLWTGNVSIPRKALIDIKGFDEGFTSWGIEDVELGYRLHKEGLKFIFNKEAKSIHFPHKINQTLDIDDDWCPDWFSRKYFYKKYQNLDTELYLTGFMDQWFNRDLNFLFENSSKRFHFEDIDKDCRIKFNNTNENTVVIGNLNSAITNFMDNPTLIEYDERCYSDIVKSYTPNKVYNLLGTMTPFSKDEFNICFITDLWIYLNEFMIFNLVKEAKRISDTVRILYQIDMNNKTEFEPNEQAKLLLEQILVKCDMSYSFSQYEDKCNKFTYIEL